MPQLTRPGLIDSVTAAAADYDLGYDVWDAEFANRYALTECFHLRFSGDVQYASIDQELRGFYDGGDALRAVAFRRHDFSGAGPYVGYDGDWRLPAGFSVYGGARAGLTYGEITSQYIETNTDGGTVNAALTEDYSAIIPMMRVGLGVGYNRGKFGVRAGYEVVNWFDLVQQPFGYDDFARGKIDYRPADLSLEGFVVRVGWAY